MQENTFKNALAENTMQVFDTISKLECIKDLVLCGGTAQSLQMSHRKSEDLDFELIGTKKSRPVLDAAGILNEVQGKFPGADYEALGPNHFLITLQGNVKLSFFRPENNVPTLTVGLRYNNIKTPTLQELLGMKLYVITQRTAFRDYYDIYSLLKKGYNLHDGIKYACDFSKHDIHSKDILKRLVSPSLFKKDESFNQLNPIYNVNSNEIYKVIQNTMLAETKNITDNDKIYKNIKASIFIIDFDNNRNDQKQAKGIRR